MRNRLRIIACGAIMLSLWMQVFGVAAAERFASPAFQDQWHRGEIGIANFWGPLATAREGLKEPYNDAPDGKRPVQYFDKTRMELTNPATGNVTNGLLTIEMVTGRLQLGDVTFEQRSPAKVNIAGDSGSAGVTYADLANAPKFAERAVTGNGTPYPWAYDNGAFNPRGNFQYKRDGDRYLPAMANGPFYPFAALGSTRPERIEGGPYGHWVYGAFVRFLQPLATSADRASAVVQTVGYPVTPYFFAQTTINGVPQWVIVQAFERRVLTMTADGLVEFGNIGQHYYQWRYGNGAAPPVAAPPANMPPADARVSFFRFAKRWGHHGYQLVVDGDGYAQVAERTYEQCGTVSTDPSIPCEDPYTSYAAFKIIRFTAVSGDTASGMILSSNSKYHTAQASVTLTLKPYDMAELKEEDNPPLTLCGPDYAKLAPPDVIRSSPCGA
jgi:hypothetical protein